MSTNLYLGHGLS